MTGYRQKIREYLRYISGKRVIEIFLEPKKSCRYYWKSQIHMDGNKYRVRFYDRFGEQYSRKPSLRGETADSPLFRDLEEAKIHVRRTLLCQ